MLHRPPFHLSQLSVPDKWESTRRHPLYLALWKIRQYAGDDASRILRLDPRCQAARLALRISGEPENPSLEFDQLGETPLPAAWLRGAIQPVSVRTIAGVLVNTLPPPLLKELADCFLKASDTDDDQAKLLAMQRLIQSDVEHLDDLLDAPFYSVSPVAPREQTIADLSKEQEKWRRRQELPDSRSRGADYPKYLEVWDLREGWSGGEYRGSAEHKLSEIAKMLGRSISTVNDQYGRAFWLITGHPYSPENWLRVMGVEKISRLGSGGPTSLRRRRQAHAPANVDDTTLSGGDPGRSVIGAALACMGDQESVERLIDIRELVAKGWTDEEILAELELQEEALPEIQGVRDREL